MKPGASGALSDLPARGRWDFGGFAYGLEPLILPAVGAPDAEHPGPAGVVPDGAYEETCRHLRALGERGLPAPGVAPSDSPHDLFWFRWITGHQVCFIVWRLIAQLLDDLAEGRRSAGEVAQPISRYVDGYSAMLLYTGSCPRDLYNALIRPSMRLRHRAFSGSWAPDYWPIRDLFRRRRLPPMAPTDAEELAGAITLLQRVHDGVAARLVTNGKSLLREAEIRGPGHRLAGIIYDSYFTTLRTPVPRHEVVAQLLRRLVAIAQDVAANGLYPIDTDDERPPELRTPEVLKFEDGLADTLLSIARHACELAAEPPLSDR
jgi:L-tyrosine peroxygenase